MNETKQRREQLLKEARSIYDDKNGPPAVHPRYRRLYSQLYKNEHAQGESSGGSFGVRLMISLLLFALFLTVDYQNVTFLQVDSKQVVQQIESQLDVQAVWNSLP